MIIKTVVASIALTLSLTVSPIYASPWIVTTNGTISSGYDYGVFFGAGYQDLTGKSYSLTIDIDPNLNAQQFGYVYNQSQNGSLMTIGGAEWTSPSGVIYGAPSTITATINGISNTTTIDPNIIGTFIGGNLQWITNNPGTQEENGIESSTMGYNQNKTDFTMANQSIFNSSVNSIVSYVSFDVPLTYTVQTGDSTKVSWSYSNPNGGAGFSGTPTSLIIATASSAPVLPIPAAAWLFGSVLAGMIGFARRKKF